MRILLASALILALAAPVQAAPRGGLPQVGQTFRCAAPGGRNAVVIVVGKVDRTPKGAIVSVSMTPEDGMPEIAQVAIQAPKATRGCKAAPRRALSTGFAKAYGRWKSGFDRGMGTVFDQSPAEVYGYIQNQNLRGE